MKNFFNNQINQMNMRNNMINQMMQANIMSNCQAELMRMDYISHLNQYNSNLYSPASVPATANSIVEDLEKFFSLKNLNRDINLRKNMDENNGNVSIDFILNLPKFRSINLKEEEEINTIIDKVGSDIIEKVMIDDKLYLRPKNFEEIKDKLISIEEIEKKNSEKENKKNNKNKYNKTCL